ncbi:MAG: hypothetical protein IPK00_20520 [Deltaproteobacteria bacterium]|nr:hypothetical protein [Deltaproteobacteria bacterium]
MVEAEMTRDRHDDPRKLTAMIARVSDLAANHAVCSVVVGVAAEEGDLFFPDYLDYLVSALRVEDQIFRMTRERALLYLSDVDATCAAEVLVRIYPSSARSSRRPPSPSSISACSRSSRGARRSRCATS